MLFQTHLSNNVWAELAVPSAGQTHGHTHGSGTSAPCPAVSGRASRRQNLDEAAHDQHQPPGVRGSGKAIEPERERAPRHSH